MIYTKHTKIAMRIAFDAHKEQTDKTGLPYIFHPFHLPSKWTPKMKCVLRYCMMLLRIPM